MASDGWMTMDSLPVPEKKEDARKVIVWHVFNGAMVYDTMHARNNRFCVYWREPPTEWNDPREKLPTAADADPQGCLLAIDRFGELQVRGWHLIQNAHDARAWARRPEPPKDYKELRNGVF